MGTLVADNSPANETHFATVRAGREHLSALVDAAAAGKPASIARRETKIAAVDSARLVDFLAATIHANAQMVSEPDGWSLFLPGLPIAADGETLDEVLDEAVEALRSYSRAWVERLRLAPNHSENWGLVQLVDAASDDRLKAWLVAQ
ncbi:hypothetical protein ACXR2T_07205 [Leucobacter sp. HY1910]